jgi:hypothetical protein
MDTLPSYKEHVANAEKFNAANALSEEIRPEEKWMQ